jgi:hypothetical protein
VSRWSEAAIDAWLLWGQLSSFRRPRADQFRLGKPTDQRGACLTIQMDDQPIWIRLREGNTAYGDVDMVKSRAPE